MNLYSTIGLALIVVALLGFSFLLLNSDSDSKVECFKTVATMEEASKIKALKICNKG